MPVFLSILVITLLLQLPTKAQSTLELFANYHSIGVNVALTPADPEKDAWATLQYRTAGAATWETGFPLSRVDNDFNRLSGSIFWRQPNTLHEIRVILQDASTGALHNVTLTDTIRTLAEIEYPAGVTTYYVSPNGSGNLFTLAQPGLLPAALAAVQAGGKIVLLPGNYYTGNLTLANNGTQTAPIIIEGPEDQSAILNGKDTTQFVWTPTAGNPNIYYTYTLANNPNLVIANGKRLYPHRTFEDLAQHLIGTGVGLFGEIREPTELDGFYRNPLPYPCGYDNTIWVKFHDNANPNTKDMVITRFAKALTIQNSNHVYIKNLSVTNYGVTPGSNALHILNSSNILIDNCRFINNDNDLLLEGNSNRITIQNCRFSNSMNGFQSWEVKATYLSANSSYCNPFTCGCYPEVFPYYGRLLERGAINYQHGFGGRGIVIRNCEFYDYGQAGQLAPPSFNANFTQSYEIDFYNNLLYNCTEDGMEIDGDSRNTRVWNNVFHHVNAPLSLAVAQCGPTYIIRNLFYNMVADTFIYNPVNGKLIQDGHPLKFQSGYTQQTGDVFFFHNTVAAQHANVALDIGSTSGWTRFSAINNILVADTNFALLINTAELYPSVLDYNSYYSNLPDFASVKTQTSNAVQTFTHPAGLFTAFGYEQHGSRENPLFINAALNNYHLQPDSPCIDAAQLIYGINDQAYCGTAPDRGAFEYMPSIAVTGEPVVCQSQLYTYSANYVAGASYLWSVTGGVIVSGQGTNTITVLWSTSSTGLVNVMLTPE
ncbi:hypothetical protein C7N43_04675 [Sphingobacteriales bacterium UPWRP_1]|nr:hypothetical protein BVG80_07270 [Sphingobacteriales bacterium TSM_CSM]PSJ78230.1 hypothetical protein C7N43_04675 [Sphingobacteriales bacterium UPWRP_1]